MGNGRASIPCRRTGDVQVSYEAHGGDVDVVIRRWTTTESDPDQGCARAGRLDDVQDLPENVAQGAVNDEAITSRLPGAYDGAVPAQRFGEASLNLAALLEQTFGEDCLAFTSIWMHSRASRSVSSNLKDYVAPRRLHVRTCSASGTKFFDSDADGRRDPGEPGIPRFLIWADYDDDGVRHVVEPFAVSDDAGRYVIYDIRPPDGTYMLRETLLLRRLPTRVVATDWICSFPHASTPGGTGSAPGGRFGCAWGPIDAGATPNAVGRDFGNWFPARLTIEKEIEPAGDNGRFDLLLDGEVVVPAAGDGASVTVSLAPGTYAVSERPAAGTDAADYDSTVECRRNAAHSGARRDGPAYGRLDLSAGDEATCTFRNIRVGAPAIAIRKTGPEVAVAGDSLSYTLRVSNAGDVAFDAAAVEVTDPACDERPRLVSKGSDSTPGTLDLGDTWVYRCSRRTDSQGHCASRRASTTPQSSPAPPAAPRCRTRTRSRRPALPRRAGAAAAAASGSARPRGSAAGRRAGTRRAARATAADCGRRGGRPRCVPAGDTWLHRLARPARRLPRHARRSGADLRERSAVAVADAPDAAAAGAPACAARARPLPRRRTGTVPEWVGHAAGDAEAGHQDLRAAAARTLQRMPRRSGCARRDCAPGLSAVQVPHDGQYAAVIVRARRDAELAVDMRDVLDDRPLGQEQPLGDAGVAAALRHQRQHLALAVGQLRQRLARRPGEHRAHDLGIEH
jgi:uncharacterized repeat protein (TIGR01451 family)